MNMAFQALFERSGDGRSAAVLPNHALNAALPDLVHSRLRPGGIYVVTIVRARLRRRRACVNMRRHSAWRRARAQRCPRVGPHATPLLDLMKRLERRFRLARAHTLRPACPTHDRSKTRSRGRADARRGGGS